MLATAAAAAKFFDRPAAAVTAAAAATAAVAAVGVDDDFAFDDEPYDIDVEDQFFEPPAAPAPVAAPDAKGRTTAPAGDLADEYFWARSFPPPGHASTRGGLCAGRMAE